MKRSPNYQLILLVTAVLAWPIVVRYGVGWAAGGVVIFLALSLLTILGPGGRQSRHQVGEHVAVSS